MWKPKLRYAMVLLFITRISVVDKIVEQIVFTVDKWRKKQISAAYPLD
jgi:hypothetical protein